MKAALFLAIAFCAVLPVRLVAALLPAIWTFQRLLPIHLELPIRVGPLALQLSDFVILILLARLALSLVLEKKLVLDRALYLAFGVYLAVNLISTLVAGIKFGQLGFAGSAIALARFSLELLVIPILAHAIKNSSDARFCLRIVLGTLVVLAGIQFFNYAGAGYGLVIGEVQGLERGEARYFGPLGDSVGVVLLLGYLASLCFASLAGTALFLGGIVLTAGLGAVLAAGVGTILFFLFGTRTDAVRKFIRQRLWLIPVLALVALLALTVFARPMGKTLLDRLTTGNYAHSGAQRGMSIKLAGPMILDNPFLGVGYMGYEQALARYGGEKYFELGIPDGATANANNQILQSLTDSGIFGLLAFAALVVCAARLFLRIATRSEDRFLRTFYLAAFLWLLAQVFGNQTAVWLNPSSFTARLLWISLGIAVALARLLPMSAQRPSPSNATPVEPQLLPA